MSEPSRIDEIRPNQECARVYQILLLAEETVTEHDVNRLVQLHEGEELHVHVLVPADTEHHRLIEALDEAALGNLREAIEGEDDATPQQAEQDAMHDVNASIALFTAAGVEAHGSVTGDDPVPAALEATHRDETDEVVVVTPPHIVSDGLHQGWASRLRNELDLPVLHVISGTDRVVR